MYVERYESPQALKWTRPIPGDKDLAQYRIPEATRDLHTAGGGITMYNLEARHVPESPEVCARTYAMRYKPKQQAIGRFGIHASGGCWKGMHIFLELLAKRQYTVSIDIDTH